KPGEDCDDSNYNVFTADGCANCVDEDMDGVWVGCDQYGDMAPGPDCDDDNPDIGLGDQQELCNGLAENCAGEIDNAPADEMCGDKDWPNVAAMNGYCCEPPAPGEDGCCIQNCVDQFFDLDENDSNGCECAGTSRDHSRAFCSDELQGYLGSVAEGDQLDDLLPGTIPELDNGFEGGREDWYSVDFPAEGNPGARPNTGSIQVDFAQNDGGDYRFEVYRTCDGEVFGGPYGNNHNALVKTFGAGAPPTLEWWFYDYHPDIAEWPDPVNPVAWPSKVYIRVFRVQNGNTCNAYRLRIQRIPN
ncbi:MAG: hypothetical protein KC431_17880, partial [Myxococcales bacterium]|nr:hypothetical protein [Myxococcales bacterium]